MRRSVIACGFWLFWKAHSITLCEAGQRASPRDYSRCRSGSLSSLMIDLLEAARQLQVFCDHQG